jgi:hypothetical protein
MAGCSNRSGSRVQSRVIAVQGSAFMVHGSCSGFRFGVLCSGFYVRGSMFRGSTPGNHELRTMNPEREPRTRTLNCEP